MEKSAEKAGKFRLRLLIDEKKNKVVLAETCRDFIDVLFSLLTLPMGTIIRLIKKHQKLQPAVIGECFTNLYTSVSDMVVDDFETEACRSMLLYPRSTKEIHCRRLKLNIDDTEDTKFFTCNFFTRIICRKYNNFNTSRCSCGDLMTRQFQLPEEEQIGGPIRNGEDGVFVHCRSSYIVTDDLKVTLSSLGVIVNVLNGLGYANFDDLQEIFLDVGFEEVLTLMGNLFLSEFPLTCTFFREPFKGKVKKVLSNHAHNVEHIKGGNECYVKLFVRKFNRKILYAECGEDFVDNLLSFLVLPLELAWSLSNDSTVLGCVGNLCQSECRGGLASTSLEIPCYYTFSKQILDIPTQTSVEYECLKSYDYTFSFARQFKKTNSSSTISATPTDPKVKSGTSSVDGSGFVKRNSKFIVSDDLVITPMGSSSTIGLLMKSRINISDLEEQGMSISKAELLSILRASLISRSALTNGLSNVLAKRIQKKQVVSIGVAEVVPNRTLLPNFKIAYESLLQSKR